jgi:hypothetical protein
MCQNFLILFLLSPFFCREGIKMSTVFLKASAHEKQHFPQYKHIRTAAKVVFIFFERQNSIKWHLSFQPF